MAHGPNPGFKPGDHWAECMRCGFDYYASELRQEWNGLWVCKKCWEPRHPGDFVRVPPEDSVPLEPVNPPAVDGSENVTSDLPDSTFNQTDPV